MTRSRKEGAKPNTQVEEGRDVSAEIARVKAEEKHQLLAENVDELICIHDADGRIDNVTPSAKRLLGYELEELTGKGFSICLGPS